MGTEQKVFVMSLEGSLPGGLDVIDVFDNAGASDLGFAEWLLDYIVANEWSSKTFRTRRAKNIFMELVEKLIAHQFEDLYTLWVDLEEEAPDIAPSVHIEEWSVRKKVKVPKVQHLKPLRVPEVV